MLEAWLVQTEILLIASVRWKLPYQNRSFFYFVKIIYIQSIKLGSTKDLLGWNLYHYSNVTRAESHSYRHIFKLFSCNQSWTICHKAQNDSEDGWCEFRPENILCGKNLICILRHWRVPVLRPIKILSIASIICNQWNDIYVCLNVV